MFFLVEPILREVWPALFEILHTHKLRNPFPIQTIGMSLSLKFKNASVQNINFTSCFKISDSASASR